MLLEIPDLRAKKDAVLAALSTGFVPADVPLNLGAAMDSQKQNSAAQDREQEGSRDEFLSRLSV